CDVHTDLRAAAGQQCAAAGQIRAGVAAAVTQRGAVRAQLVVEGVDAGVLLLADVAAARPQQGPGRRAGGGRADRDPGRFVVDPIRRPGGGGGYHRAIGIEFGLPGGDTALPFELLEHAADGALDRDRVRVAGVQPACLFEYAQTGGEVVRIDTDRGHR